ncbi:MAG: septum formation initiator family protein [Bacteroidetes bacterium]|jgi:cell division protein DivIC|nr:septum formation initiator family protein [Bacteroidota bacterium]MDA1148713.1 septum formation initiator family protein [Bacteroidota bacterium]
MKNIKLPGWMNLLKNIYLLISLFFVIWMVFFDSNSVLIQWQLSKEIRELEREKRYLQKEIAKDKLLLEKFADSLEKERFARETYYFKRANEDIFIIEFQDSLKKAQ